MSDLMFWLFIGSIWVLCIVELLRFFHLADSHEEEIEDMEDVIKSLEAENSCLKESINILKSQQ